ncbi:hypothetical protein [Mesorhizobium sp. 8]|uniref:hypothetical protein n=1 Tax=Mesorhizobium sp. 8 TaxID=2584466 RepID=UPI00111D2CA8|nr:hypothetical protein [Mesorhizobium sp. 8]QDC00385.1 hypothetical protein FGU64_08120 [Mesorhizobium sp. 8]
MADVLLATVLLFGGICWSGLVLLAMANSPTGGTNFAMVPFIAGLAAAALGALYWMYIVAGWLF